VTEKPEPIELPAAPGTAAPGGNNMIDPFGRHVSYLRVSVTDRCDFRCVYCMAENMTFLPKRDVLTLEELDRLCSAFVEKGVRKLRLTGGEPAGEVKEPGKHDAMELAGDALDGLTRRIAAFDDEVVPYLPRVAPESERTSRDFDHLGRYLEWAKSAPGGEST